MLSGLLTIKVSKKSILFFNNGSETVKNIVGNRLSPEQ
jgi:hypothetical protein